MINRYISKGERFISIWPVLVTFRLTKQRISDVTIRICTIVMFKIFQAIYLASFFQGCDHDDNRYILFPYHSPKIPHCVIVGSLRSDIFSWAVEALFCCCSQPNDKSFEYVHFKFMYHNIRSVDIIRIRVSW